jgi:hypothetical protein
MRSVWIVDSGKLSMASPEFTVISVLLALEPEARDGVIRLSRIEALVNSDRPPRERITSRRLGALVRALGLTTRRRTPGMVVDYEADYIALLATRHGITERDNEL